MAFRRHGKGLAAAIVILLHPVVATAQEPEPSSEEPQWQEGPAPDPDPQPQPQPQPAPAPAPAPVAPPPVAVPPAYPYPPPWRPAPEDPMRTDPLLPVGITFLCIGALSAVVGALVYANDEKDLVCGTIGGDCVERPDHTREIVAAGLMGSGVGMAVVSVPAIIQGVGKKPREGYRRSHGMVAAGSVFAHLGGGIFGIGAGSMIADSTYGLLDAKAAEAALMGVGGALAVLGGVLWGFGAERIDTESVALEGAR